MFGWRSPEDAMPWVGLYVFIVSLVCTLAMAVDAFQGFRQWKLWFPCRFFTLNAASITLMAIAMKLPVDLTTNIDKSFDSIDSIVKLVSVIFFVTMLANFLPSLGLMNDKELAMNIVALSILVITVTVNVWIRFITPSPFWTSLQMLSLIFPLPWLLSVALTAPTSRRIIEYRYKELHNMDSIGQDIKFSYKELVHYVKKYWMMAETGNPQFAIACSPVSCAFGVICLLFVCFSLYILVSVIMSISHVWHLESDYEWSIGLILIIQSVGVVIGSIAPIFRCLTSISYFNLSKKASKKHLNVFQVEKHWIQRILQWRRNNVHSHIPGRQCKKVFHHVKNMILNFCLALQITVVVTCKIICLVPISFLILLSCSWHFCRSLLKRYKVEPNALNNNVGSQMQEYTRYVLQIEEDAKLSKRILRKNFNTITRLLIEFERKEPNNLMKLLKKSRGFNGVAEFENDQVPPLYSEEIQNSWSLVTVTLVAIALALPNIAKVNVKELLDSMKEGLQFVRHIEERLNENEDLVEARKASRRIWTEIEVYRRWLEIDLQKKARKGKTSKEILRWLGDEAVKFVIQFKIRKDKTLDDSLYKFLVASSMYKISQSVLIHYEEQEIWPDDEQLFEWILNITADILSACFTNLPRVITMKCHHNAIQKRADSIRSAAQLLGKSQKILKILEPRQLSQLDVDSMAFIDKWRALLKSEIPNAASVNKIEPASSSSSSESLIVTIIQ